MEIKPLGKRLLAKHIKEEQKTSSGIYLGNDVDKALQKATVVAAADDCTIAVGATVMYPRYSGDAMLIEGEMHEFVDEVVVSAVCE